MSFGTKTRTRLAVLRSYPTDMALISVGAVLAYLAVTSFQEGSVLRLAGAISLVAFVPGYAFVSVLFPARARNTRDPQTDTTERGGINTAERLGLSLALSLTIAPVVALGLAVSEWGLTMEPAVTALAGLSVVLAQLGALRRLRVPATERFTVAPLESVTRVTHAENGTLSLTSVVLALAIVSAAGALLLGFLAPLSAGGFSELGMYTEDENGTLVAGDFPDEIEPGDEIPVTLSITNQEGEDRNYTAVVQQQVIEDDEVQERTELDVLEVDVDDGEELTTEHSIVPTAETNETVRVSVLLYDGEPPVAPTNENAIQDVYFWVTVAEAEE